MTLPFIVLGLLIMSSGFFSASETAFTSLSLYQIQELVHRYGKRGAIIERLTNRPDLLLTTILIGNNLVNIAASALATTLTITLFGSGTIGIMTGLMTLLILIFGEVTPKRIAIAHNEFVCLHTCRLINILSIVFRPVIHLVVSMSSLITRLFGTKDRFNVTRESVLHMVNLAESNGVLEHYKTHMVKNVFRFSDVTASAVMTHRTRVFSLEMMRTIREVREEIIAAGYSRIPVYDEDPEHIVGIILVKEIMKHTFREDEDLPLRAIMMKPFFIPHSKKIGDLFVQFKREKLNMAVVLDEYGGLAGVVTVEDVIEEILGELYDENEKRGREKISSIGENTFMIMGDTPIHLLQDTLNIRLTHGKDIQTLSGYIAELAGRIPGLHEVISTDAGTFVVENVSRNRILSIRFTRQPHLAESS